jgi:hypothetical protein
MARLSNPGAVGAAVRAFFLRESISAFLRSLSAGVFDEFLSGFTLFFFKIFPLIVRAWSPSFANVSIRTITQ